jgi:WD40 repeat protein
VTVSVKGGGEEIEIDNTTGWQVRLKEGTYQVDLKGIDDRFRLSENTLTITRGSHDLLRVEYEPRVAQVSPPGAAAGSPPVTIQPEPQEIKPGEPLCGMALTAHPAPIPGVQAWTFETLRHRGDIRAIVYSPDGTRFATGGEDGTVRLCDAASGLRMASCCRDVLMERFT